jgi:heme exporter protein A
MVARLVDVSKRYGARWALARLSLDLPAGRAVLLTGENGAGKTTLLKVLATSIRPTFGTVNLFGVEAADHLDEVRAKVGLLTHQSHLYFDLTGRENLELTARLSSRPTSLVPALLDRCGMTAHADRPARIYSAGMKQRLALARTLLREPRLVLLDEPFSALDPSGVALMESVVRELVAGGATVVLSTHDVERGRALCDEHVELADGRLVRQGQA